MNKKIILISAFIIISVSFFVTSNSKINSYIASNKIEALSEDENWHPSYHKDDNCIYYVTVTKTIYSGPYNIPITYDVQDKRSAVCCMSSMQSNWCNFADDPVECNYVEGYSYQN